MLYSDDILKRELDSVNPQQKAAILHTNGPLLILAGAGSGKTKVVSLRIAHLIHTGVPAESILGVTFTNKAAGEMKERVERYVGKQVLISTFHSLGVRILRESAHHLGYSTQFVIYDEEDSEKLLKNLIKELFGVSAPFDAKQARNAISKAKNNLFSEDLEEFSQLYNLYESRLKAYNAVDFDDLLLLPVKLFKTCPEVLSMYQQRFLHVLVDEYQDTNHAQYEFVRLLVEKSHNLFVVGDPDQSIYSWRGANIDNILNFERDYQNASIIRLEQNYRSTQTILEAANAVIRNNSRRYEKSLWSALGEGEKICVASTYSEREEASFVTRTMLELHDRHEIPFSNMVVFYRTNFQSRALEDECILRRIPYTIVGGLSFYQRKEIKDILAYLRILEHPSDLLAFTRIINIPKRGLGDAFVSKLITASAQARIPIREMFNAPAPFPLTAKQKEGWEHFRQTVATLEEIKQTSPLTQLVRATISSTGYLQMVEDDEETRDERKENLSELIAKAAEWESAKDNPSLFQFLEEIALATSTDVMTREGDRINLMTVHNGKGLEFRVVFLVGVEEELFPHINSKGSEEGTEEERRLFYVGMTRAKEKLFISYVAFRSLWGTTRQMRPSRFVQEIPYDFKIRATPPIKTSCRF